MDIPREIYFAYGSNMDMDQMLERCPSAKHIGTGVLYECKIGFTRFSSSRGSSVADVIPQKNGNVWGLLYSISADDVRKLDSCEGVPNAYRRVKKSIYFLTPDNSPFLKPGKQYEELNQYKDLYGAFNEGWTYEVVNKTHQPNPTGAYFDMILKAVYQHRFPSYYVDEILKYASKTNKVVRDRCLAVIENYRSEVRSHGWFPFLDYQKEWRGLNFLITGDWTLALELDRSHPDQLVICTLSWKELSWTMEGLMTDPSISWMIKSRGKDAQLQLIGKSLFAYQKANPFKNDTEKICLKLLDVFEENLMQI